MAAITKSWTDVADAALNPDAPITTTLMYAMRDDLQFLHEWMGASYYAGATQDHNHDGSNSAKISVGPNLLRNGDFEGGLANWTATQYTGGTVVASAANADGAASVAITSTVLANGGGDILNNEFIVCDGGAAYAWAMNWLANVANVSGKLEAEFYDNTQAHISTSVLSTSANVPTANTLVAGVLTTPAAARYMKSRATGGIPATGTAVGTVTFDSLFLTRAPAGTLIAETVFTASGTFTPTTATRYIFALLVGGGGAGGGAASSAGEGGKSGAMTWVWITVPIAASYLVTIGAGGTAVSGGIGNQGGNTSLGSFSAQGGWGGVNDVFTNSLSDAGDNGYGAGAARRSGTGAGIAAAANTGAGGSGAVFNGSLPGGAGGSGIALIWEFA